MEFHAVHSDDRFGERGASLRSHSNSVHGVTFVAYRAAFTPIVQRGLSLVFVRA